MAILVPVVCQLHSCSCQLDPTEWGRDTVTRDMDTVAPAGDRWGIHQGDHLRCILASIQVQGPATGARGPSDIIQYLDTITPTPIATPPADFLDIGKCCNEASKILFFQRFWPKILHSIAHRRRIFKALKILGQRSQRFLGKNPCFYVKETFKED